MIHPCTSGTGREEIVVRKCKRSPIDFSYTVRKARLQLAHAIIIVIYCHDIAYHFRVICLHMTRRGGISWKLGNAKLSRNCRRQTDYPYTDYSLVIIYILIFIYIMLCTYTTHAHPQLPATCYYIRTTISWTRVVRFNTYANIIY